MFYLKFNLIVPYIRIVIAVKIVRAGSLALFQVKKNCHYYSNKQRIKYLKHCTIIIILVYLHG